MAIVYLTTGEERYIKDALLIALTFEPLKKKQLRDQIQNLKDQKDNFPAMTNAEKIAFAETHNPQYMARNQIIAQIDRLQQELEQWP